jgi:acyl-CoA hydrolase
MTKKSETEYPELTMLELIFPHHANHHGTLFGGVGLSLMDKMAFMVATRAFRKNFVTASSDKNDFKVPVKVGHIVELHGKVKKVGKTSVTVHVDLYSEVPLTGERTLCTSGSFVMVAVDEDQRPIPLV